MDITTLEMSWKQILIASRRINRGLLASSSGRGDPVPRGFLSGNLSRFHQHFCDSGLRIIWSGTRNVPWHASWEQGYHGLIIPIIREIQNREHFNLRPGTFVSLSLVSRNFNSLFSAPRGPPQQTELRPGVREICVFFIFPLRVFCNPSSSVSAASAAPPSSAFSSVSVFCGHFRGHLPLNVETPTPAPGRRRIKERRRGHWHGHWSWRIALTRSLYKEAELWAKWTILWPRLPIMCQWSAVLC